MIHTPGQVQGKYAINTGVFPGGHITTDNSWINLWRQGQNAALGWRAGRPAAGSGRRSSAPRWRTAARSPSARCRRCSSTSASGRRRTHADAAAVSAIATEFERNRRYDLRQVFADVAIHCTEGE